MRTIPSSIYRKLRPLQLAAIIFLTVSGGPYGLEPLLFYAGKHGALLLLILVPLLWDIPTIFTVLELNSMMPVNGGYYQWVKRALGRRCALYEGWWTWLYTFVDLAIYPVLFVEYASFFFPGFETYKIPVCLCIIWLSATMNILGVIPVARMSLVLTAAILAPFIIFFIVAFSHSHSFAIPPLSLKGINFSAVGLGLYTVMWNFLGWDNTTTYAEEVDKPVRSYLISVATSFGLVFVLYFITIIAAQNSGIDFSILKDKGFPVLGEFVGGKWLGVLLALGGMASALGLFSAVLLSVSRVPKVMADDKLLSPKLSKLHPKFNTPYISIIICSLVVSVMIIFWSFEQLLIIDITIYGAALFLEFISLIVLRIKAPDEHRPFKIPFNIAGLCLMILLPLSVYVIAITATFFESAHSLTPVLFAIGVLLTGEIVWQVIVWRSPKSLSA